jgi:cytochrome c biogenesis protein CcdA
MKKPEYICKHLAKPLNYIAVIMLVGGVGAIVIGAIAALLPLNRDLYLAFPAGLMIAFSGLGLQIYLEKNSRLD